MTIAGMIDVKSDCGAIGDGVQDDTLAIQEAFDRVVSAGGGTVYFPDGVYEMSSKGVYDNPWLTASAVPAAQKIVHYAVLVEGGVDIRLEFSQGAKCRMNMADGTKANMFTFHECSRLQIAGARAEGYNTPAHKKYDGALISLYSCKDVTVTGTDTLNMFHTIVAFRSESIYIYEAFGRRQGVWNAAGTAFDVAPPEHGTFIGIYSSSNCIVRDCQTYGSCQDGDIGIFGGGRRNVIERCFVYNYFYDDQINRRITFTAGQGIYVDSGARYTSVSKCYVYGYYYGIDVKTDVESTVVSENWVFKCMVGIAARRGEGDIMLEGVVIRNNNINPDGGNGRANFSWIGGSTVPGGIYIQDVAGVTIEGNTFANSITSTNSYPPSSMNNKDFIGIGINYSGSWSARGSASWVPITIRNNDFWLEQRMSENGLYGSSSREAIYILGTATTRIPEVNIQDNTFDSRYIETVTATDYPNGLIRAYYVTGLRIRGNTFGDTYTTKACLVIENCADVDVSGNRWGYNCGLASFNVCEGVKFNDNTSFECIAASGTRVYIGMVDVTQPSVHDNKMYRRGTTTLDSFYISASAGVTGLMASRNDLNLAVKNSTNWINGTVTQGLVEKNMIKGVLV